MRLPRPYLAAIAGLPLAGLLALTLAAPLDLDLGPPRSGGSIGAAAPDFAVVDLDGNAISLEALRGRPVMVNFWSSSCHSCLAEFPKLEEALDRWSASGLAVVGIVYQDRWSSARDFMRLTAASWPAAMDPGDRIAQAYGVYGTPETFFIDGRGRVVARQFGPFTGDSLERNLALILPAGGS